MSMTLLAGAGSRTEKTIIHIPNVNSRESTKDKIKEVEHIIEELGEWQGTDDATGFQLVKTADGRVLRSPIWSMTTAQARKGRRRAERSPRRRTTATMSISSSRWAWPRKALTGSGASTP
jgi:hypothetical protein